MLVIIMPMHANRGHRGAASHMYMVRYPAYAAYMSRVCYQPPPICNQHAMGPIDENAASDKTTMNDDTSRGRLGTAVEDTAAKVFAVC